MSEKKFLTRSKVNIFGDEYTIKGEGSPEHITMLAEYVDKIMHQVGDRNPRLPRHIIAVLAALNIADEMSKMQKEYDALLSIIDNQKQVS